MDRAFWVVLARVWPEWRPALTIVQLATVIRWPRKRFARYWSWKSRQRGGRPRKDGEIRPLIRQMARDNVGWGASRIHGELRKLGVVVTGAAHLRRVLRDYVAYYNGDRTQVALDQGSPATRPVLPPGRGQVIARPRVRGLHHRYERRAA